MTKKDFKEQSSIHVYGHGYGAIKAIYCNRKSGETNTGSYYTGYKYAIAAQGISQADLINLAYERIIKNEVVSHSAWIGHRVALTDTDRFKVPIAFNAKQWKYSQDDYEKVSQ